MKWGWFAVRIGLDGHYYARLCKLAEQRRVMPAELARGWLERKIDMEWERNEKVLTVADREGQTGNH